MQDFTGKVAVVTGAAHGIGYAIAERLHENGMKIVLADIEAGAVAAAAERLGGGRSDVVGVATDVSSVADVERLAEITMERFGAVHVLCNNAGVNAYGFTVWEAPRATWDWVFGVNVWGTLNGINAFLPHMLAADEGHIVNTGSGATLMSAPLRSIYAASKHAMLAITESLHAELRQLGANIDVTLFIPGRHKTTIRESARRWPSHLGEPEALGPDGLRSSVPQTAELGAEDASTAADTVYRALVDRTFLAVHSERFGYVAMASRLRELGGQDPAL